MRATIGLIMRGGCSDDQIARLLTLLAAKGETVDELAGAAAAMRDQMTLIRTKRTGLLDTCGTGGTGSVTFNISTAAALVVAAAGVPVAKHGNRRVTSRSGSADVLSALGVNVAADVPTVEACLDELGICFCFAPLVHQSMKQVAPIRSRLGIPTIFNLLGPLANPARAEFQLLGVGKPRLRPLLAAALARLGVRRAVVVSGDDGLGEVTSAGIDRRDRRCRGRAERTALDAGGFWPVPIAARRAPRGRPGRKWGDDSPDPGRGHWAGARHRGAERRRGAVDSRAKRFTARGGSVGSRRDRLGSRGQAAGAIGPREPALSRILGPGVEKRCCCNLFYGQPLGVGFTMRG